jgi:hypothetical protein
MPGSLKLDAIYPALADRIRRQGRVDASLLDDPDFSSLSEADFRNAAIDTVGYLERISQKGRRKINTEEYYLVMQLAESLGIFCGLSANALSDVEKTEAEDELVRMLKPNQTYVKEDLSSGQYASLSTVWPFTALAKRLVYEK